MKIIFVILLIAPSYVIAQDISYIDMSQSIASQDAKTTPVNPVYSGNSLRYAVDMFANIYHDNKKSIRDKEESASKIEMLRSNYNSYKSFPDSITRGWHNVVVTDNLNFCRDAKVYVDKNKIKEFVIDNCIRINCSSPTAIKKGKNILTLKNFNGEQLEIVDVYFMYDMEEPFLADEPQQPGYVCFWASKNRYRGEKLEIDGRFFDPFVKIFDEEPVYSESGTISLVLKPGVYGFSCQRTGFDLRDQMIEIKPGKCLMYKLR